MRRRDIELMAALAEGTLEDETEARALVATSEEHRSEYEAQLTAINALTGLGSAQMTQTETAALHQHVWSTLRAQPTQAKKGLPWYFRVGYGAAGLLVVIGLFSALDLGGGASDSTGIAAETGGSQTFEDTQEASKATEQATRSADDTDGGEDASAAGGIAPSTPLDAPLERFLADSADRIRAGDLTSDSLTTESAYEQAELAEQNSDCVTEAGLVGYEALTFIDFEGSDPEPMSFLVAVPETTEISPATPVVFIQPDDCTIVFTAE